MPGGATFDFDPNAIKSDTPVTIVVDVTVELKDILLKIRVGSLGNMFSKCLVIPSTAPLAGGGAIVWTLDGKASCRKN
ncbi:hypothetical protein [Neolewinella persica]|uniref:hypothetical protein n=1 Tax=Neolewinella persica TaxID=70998 RepID=UPI0003756943|nr:hypothetical protein [Neolewinella persica]